MRTTQIKIGAKVEFPIETTQNLEVVFAESLLRNRYIYDLTTLIGERGEEKEKVNVRSVKGVELATYILKENDIILRARKNAVGLYVFGFRVEKINMKEKKCSAEVFFAMYDGHFDQGNEIQYTLFDPVLKLIARVQRFQFD